MGRPCGYFNVSYQQDSAIVRTKFQWGVVMGSLLLLFLLPLFITSSYWLSLFTYVAMLVISLEGLNILTGYTGQISIGHIAFMAVGAYTSAILVSEFNLPLWISLPAAGIMASVVGLVFGVPSLRMRGFYLVLATLAAYFIIFYVINIWKSMTGGPHGMVVPPLDVGGGILIKGPRSYYYTSMALMVVGTFFNINLARSRIGRAFIAIRDNDISAAVMGINVFHYKLLAFAIGTFYAGISGALFAHYWGFISKDFFPLMESIWYLGLVAIGGMGTILGPFLGVVIYKVLQEATTILAPYLQGVFPGGGSHIYSSLGLITFSLVIIAILIAEPQGLAHRWEAFKSSYRLFPFSSRF